MSERSGLRHYLTVFGTRPEVIKLAPLIGALRERGNRVTVANTGQHRAASMNAAFTRDLGLKVDVEFSAPGSADGIPAATLDQTIVLLEEAHPDAVIVLGDTITVPLVALAARRTGVPVIHVEAGLRSRNGRSIEEVNRRMAAAAASIHIAPTPLAREFLLHEGTPDDRILVAGNTITDALRLFGPPVVALSSRSGILATAHRASNVDAPERLERIVDLLDRLAGIEAVTFPVHPRTRARLIEFGLMGRLERIRGVTLTPPLEYADMLNRLSSARVVVTDSGGVQEECAWFGVPAIVLRRSTPRWEGVRSGAVSLFGIDSDQEVAAAVRQAVVLSEVAEQRRIAALPCPYGDGHVSERIADFLESSSAARLLELREDAVALEDLPWPDR
jgi:UDP-N-acetylglucosamine 2-epimerase (non-hydrolysing)